MAEIDWTALCDDAAAYLDGDHRYWDQDSGAFTWGAYRVFFSKGADTITLEVAGERRVCGRP